MSAMRDPGNKKTRSKGNNKQPLKNLPDILMPMTSYIDPTTYKKLGLAAAGDGKSCFIETFIEIGWRDPYPIDAEKLSFTIRPIEAFALPSRRLMINIIRACIAKKDTKDLWINLPYEEEN